MIHFFKKPLRIVFDNETEIDSREKVYDLISEFLPKNKRRKLKNIRLKILVPNSFGETLYKLCSPEEKTHYAEIGLSDSNGHFVIPTGSKNNYTILLNSRVFLDNQYFSTLPHELTHLIDFSAYFKCFGKIDLANRQEKLDNYYFEFYLWAEFNAKKIGLERLQKELDKKDQHIDLKQSTLIFKSDVEREKYPLNKLYHLVHHLARISIYDDGLLHLNDNCFPTIFIHDHFGSNITVFYHTLIEMKTFEDFLKEKEFIRYLVR